MLVRLRATWFAVAIAALCLTVCPSLPQGAHALRGEASPGMFDLASAWATNFGTLTLVQDGDQVEGTFVDDRRTGRAREGELRGTLDGDAFTGEWSAGGRSGDVRLDFDADQAAFSGVADGLGAWCGAPIGTPFPDGCGFAGRWSVDLGASGTGTLMLNQVGATTGASASGNFDSKVSSVKLSGKVTYSTGVPMLSGRWTAGRGSGAFRVSLANDGQQFLGSADNRTAWCGWRANAPRASDELGLSDAQRTLLGCPTEPSADVDAVTQRFENGFMVVFNESGTREFGNIDTQRFFALATDGPEDGKAWRVLFPRGTRQAFADDPVDGNQYDCEVEGNERPEQIGIPWRGFGMAWCRTSDLREALGGVRKDADNAEARAPMRVQRYGCGLALEFDDRPYALAFSRCDDDAPGALTGTWRGQ